MNSNMASRLTLNDSIIVEDYFSSPKKQEQNNIVTTSTPRRATNLIKLGEELFWEGSLECFKNFVKVDLNIEGKWTSPGGEVKVFTTKDHITKWTGKSTRKLVVMKDDSKQSVSKKLERRVTLSEDKGAEAKDQNDMHHYELDNANKNEIIDNFLIVDESQRNEFSTDQHQNELRRCSSEISTQCDADIKPCHCTEFAEQFKRIERDIESLKNRLEIDEGEEIVLACNTGTCLKEKVQLRNNLESANAKIKDLEAKIELLVCEKKSLTTAIRIIQEDNSQQNNNNCIEKQESPWVKVGDKQLKKKKKKKKRKHG